MYVGWVYDDVAYVTDRFAYSRQLPAIDPSQDLVTIGGKIEDDYQVFLFCRGLPLFSLFEHMLRNYVYMNSYSLKMNNR